MMNLCLEKRCRKGFAYHPLYPIQVDFSGGFRYSAFDLFYHYAIIKSYVIILFLGQITLTALGQLESGQMKNTRNDIPKYRNYNQLQSFYI